VDRRNTERKEEIVLGGKNAYQAHLDSLKAETDGLWVTLPTPDFAGVIKGMRLFSNMQDAVNTLLANSKIAADDSAKKIRANLALLAEAKEHAFLFNDRAALIAKASDDLKLLIQSRIADHKAAEAAKEEETRERIRAEEQAKAEKEAREKLAKEQAEAAAAELAAAKASEGAELSPAAQALYEAEGVARFAKSHPSAAGYIKHSDVVAVMPATVRQAMAPKPTAKADTPPTLTLGEISTRLGFNCTSAFLATLGFEATTVKAAKLYHSDDFNAICEAIKAHISEVQDQYEPATA
jgi:chemotaxis protein histidine kinase CheA